MSNDDKHKGHGHDEDFEEDFFEDDDDIVLTLVDEEGIEHDFFLLAEMEIKGETYRVVMAADAEEEEADEVIIFKVINDENGEELMVDIEDDEEWEMVADAWQELVDEESI